MFQPSQLVTTQPESCIQVASSYNHPFKNPRTVHGFIVPIHPVSTELDTKPPSFCCHPPSGWLARPNHWHRSHHAIYIYVHWTWHVKSCIYMIYIWYIYHLYLYTDTWFLFATPVFQNKKGFANFRESNPTHRGFRSEVGPSMKWSFSPTAIARLDVWKAKS